MGIVHLPMNIDGEGSEGDHRVAGHDVRVLDLGAGFHQMRERLDFTSLLGQRHAERRIHEGGGRV